MVRISPASFILFSLPVLAAIFFYRLDTFDPAPYPPHVLIRLQLPPLSAPRQNTRFLLGSEKIGLGVLHAPEDIAYDSHAGVIYTGTQDGWISRITPDPTAADIKVENWVNTGGRPLGIAHGLHGEVIVADADKGLLNITKNGVIELLADEAEGLKFKLTNAVDIGPGGMLYFTDTSHKYAIKDCILDLLEGTPNGRFLSYDPSTKQTRVLVKDLHIANGVAVSADKTFVIFCETAMARCQKYYIEGPKKGAVDMFVENLPGLPDNIRYDGEGRYWIALTTEASNWNWIKGYPWIRKVLGIMEKYGRRPAMEKNAGVFVVDLEGKPVAHYYDPNLIFISCGLQIGDHVYLGSFVNPYVLRLNISQYPTTDLVV